MKNTHRHYKALKATLSALESAATYIPVRYAKRTKNRFQVQIDEGRKALVALACPNCGGAGWKDYPSGDGPVSDTCLHCNEEGA
jgi:hypothetical protein